MTSETPTLSTIRRVLLWILTIGIIGTGTELILLGHTDGWQQLLPVVLAGLGIVMLAWHAIARDVRSLRALQATMVLFVVSGFAGVALHYRGNVEFASETYPTLAGWQLFRKAVTGATPALAPGTMIELGLVGLVYAYRHPIFTEPSSH